ncbi:pseudaminic acid cytidylyltransferase [Chitinimonas sp. BJB300]|uniref:pseudaminic acid cytidylyltransferase n=1 Tax=Chitinimonas sp. BJB300 TaxID=1559339 RepID=UPI000C0DBF0B|nr:pseudaminic acid cytidylyltransferase [Chitinimonas sp. BJB300]PHV12486.1 pseudaminic acid cytidylyltransferase [Chitinimonas sp. BJB300]TSJ89124.1 pseudaminic acid cytidylyltransferase [Chitinimonas sp. BJB300]
MSNVAIIPARGGSKRIPRKNIKSFHGQPMIAYAIKAARAAGLFDRIVVSTDDDEIAELAASLGAEVPFRRPPELADDHTTTIAVIQHAIQVLQAEGEAVCMACCLYATAPFVQPKYLQAGFYALSAQPDKAYAFSVTSFPFPVQRAIRITTEGCVDALYPQYRNTRSQDLEEAFHDAGQFYWGRATAWLNGEVIFSPAALPVILPRHLVQDIDTPEDWLRAEYLYSALQASGEFV